MSYTSAASIEDRSDGKLTKKEQLVRKARDAIQYAWEHDRDNRADAASDLRFLAGDQWDDVSRREREEAGRPVLTFNRLPQFMRQITNDVRQAELAIRATPVDGAGDKELAETYNGILRQIHYRSSGQHVFSTACEHQVACGIGWIRIETDYADDSGFDQEILYSIIPNPLSVYCDPAAVKPDRSDAMWIAVTENLPKKTFEARYPKATVTGVDTPSDDKSSSALLFWNTSDTIKIAEYWWKEPKEIDLALFEDGTTLDVTGFSQTNLRMLPRIVKQRKAQSWAVKSAIVSGAEVLEGPFDWAGKHIPLVPVIGAEIPLENKTYRYGAIRFARDPQMMYNYARSSAAEVLAGQPKAPYLVTPKQIAEFKGMWDTANRKNRPYLLYNPDPSAPGGQPTRLPPPQMPSAFVEEAAIAADDMKATTGIYDAGLGARSNETSGRAIAARDRQGDVANFHFIDNLKRSLEHIGRITVDLIPKIYDNERVMRILGDDGKEDFVRINVVQYDEDGLPVIMNDLSVGRFDVRVTVGPSYTTKRQEAAENMTAFMQAVPDAAPVIGDLLAQAQDWPKAEEIAKRLRRLAVQNGLVEADEEDKQAMPPPDPQEDMKAELAQRAAMAELEEMEANADNKRADARKKHAEAMRLELENQGAFNVAPYPQFVAEENEQPPMVPQQGGLMRPPEMAEMGAMPPGPAERWQPPMEQGFDPGMMGGDDASFSQPA